MCYFYDLVTLRNNFLLIMLREASSGFKLSVFTRRQFYFTRLCLEEIRMKESIATTL